MEEGSETLSIIKDPTLNGTIACYVIILLFQTPLIGLCLYGLILSYKTWRNRFQMDHKLRHWFIVVRSMSDSHSLSKDNCYG